MDKKILILFLSLSLLLIGCSETTKKEIDSETKAELDIEEKSDFEKAIEEKNLDYLYSYIQENVYDLSITDEEKITQFREAILLLFNSDISKNKEMLLTMFHNLTKDSNPLLAAKLIKVLENEDNQHYLKNFEDLANSYMESLKKYENHDTEVVIAQEEFNKLADQYPFPTDFVGEELKFLSSIITQKLSDHEYVFNYNGEKRILNTFDTVFTSQGRFNLQVIEGPEKSYTRLDGFNEVLTVWYEVPEQYVEQANELLAAKRNVDEVKSQIDIYFDEMDYSSSALGTIINNVFNSNGVEAVSDDIFDESNGFSIYGLRLGDNSSRIDEILGDDFISETDGEILQMSEASEIRKYENIEIYLYENKITSMFFYLSEDDFKQKILNKTKFEKLLMPEPSEGGKKPVIIYNPNNSELIISKYDQTGEYYVTIQYDDGNFSYYYNEGGYYEPYTE